MSVLIPKEINTEYIKFNKPKEKKGYHESILQYQNTNDLIIQTPILIIDNADQDNGFILQKIKSNNDFYSLIRKIEYIAVNTSSINSKTWFKQNLSKEILNKMFKSCLETPQTLNGNFKFKIKMNKSVKVFNENKELIDTELEPNTQIKCILKIRGILFGRNFAKLDIRCQKIAIVKSKQKEEKTEKEEEDISDYDSDMDIDFNPQISTQEEQPTQEEEQQPIQEEEEQPTQEEEQQPTQEEEQQEEQLPQQDQSQKNNDIENKKKSLIKKLQHYIEEGDYKNIQQISQELKHL